MNTGMLPADNAQACPTSCGPNTEAKTSELVFSPRVDVFETPEELTILADMPGVDASRLDVKYEDRVLHLSGPVKPRGADDRRYLAREYRVGDYRRSFKVHESVDAEKISAVYQDGVLAVHLPKLQAAKSRKIDVRVNG